MAELNFEGVHPDAAERVRPFLEEVAGRFAGLVRATYVTGSAVTPDFNEATSDVNSLLVLNEVPLDFLNALAPLGRKYGKRRVRAPLLMTPRDFERSLDVFPVEFLDLKLVHQLVMGEDLLAGIEVGRTDMRAQCEREMKGRALRLRQDYVHALGDETLLRDRLVGSLVGLIPLLRGTLFALGKETPRDRAGILAGLRAAAGCETEGIEALILIKAERRKPRIETLMDVFAKYHAAIVRLADVIDAST